MATGAGVILLRGMRRRCPRCGAGHLFTRWFRMREQCQGCGLRLEPEEAAFLGSMTINYGVTGAVWMVLLIVWLAVSAPHIELVPLIAASAALVTVLPMILYPFTKTTWAAIDLLLHGGAREGQPDGPRGGEATEPGGRSSGIDPQ